MADMILERDTQTGTEMAWHNKTNVVDVITKDNCRICYPMEKQPLTLPSGEQTGFFGIVSTDDGKIIGNPVGQGYSLISNDEIFGAVESALLGTSHQFVSVGTVYNRAIGFISVKIADEFKTENGIYEPFLNIIWGHGGTKGIISSANIYKAVCANTVRLSLGYKSNEFRLSMKHSKTAKLELVNMSKAIEAHYGVIAEFNKAMNELANKPLAQNKAESFFAGFISRNEEKEKLSTRSLNTIERLTNLFAGGAGNRGQTMADGFNAITDYYTHESSGGEDTWKQFESSEFGVANTRKSEAFSLFKGNTLPEIGNFDSVVKRGEALLLAS